MKATFAIVVVVLSLTAFPGCGDKSTPGGDTNTKPPMIGEADKTFKLTVPSNVPYETAVKQGETTAFKIGISRGKNFDEDVTLEFKGLPAGVTVEPSPAAIKHGESEANLKLKAADDAALGSVTVKVTGTPTKGGAGANEFKINVTKKAAPAAFTVHVPLLSTGIKQGESKEVTITIKKDSGFDEDVTLKFDPLPPGLSFDPPSPVIKQGQTETKVMLKAAGDAAVGDKTVKVTGQGKGIETAQDLKVTVEKK